MKRPREWYTSARIKALIESLTPGKFLMVVKPDGRVDLPGGRRDRGETLDMTLRRELREEMSATVRAKYTLLGFSGPENDRTAFVALKQKMDIGAPMSGSEVSEVKAGDLTELTQEPGKSFMKELLDARQAIINRIKETQEKIRSASGNAPPSGRPDSESGSPGPSEV